MPHSPLPWGVNSLGEIISSDGYHVTEAIFGFDTTEDDANLIVNAVNHHGKLVASLEQCLKLIEDEGFNTRHDVVSREAREVLASIKGEPVVIAPPEPAHVLIEVSRGVAYYTATGNVTVELIDHDCPDEEYEEFSGDDSAP